MGNPNVFRIGIALSVAIVLLLNVVFFSRSRSDFYTNASDAGLDKSLEVLTSNKYTESLKESMIEANKDTIMEEIKQDLLHAHREKIMEDLRKEIKDENEKGIVGELKEKIVSEYTKSFFSLREKNYDLLRDLELKYYEENKDKFKELEVFSAVDEVLGQESTPDLKTKVRLQIEKSMSRKEYFRFVLEDLIMKNRPTMGPLNEEENGPDLKYCAFSVNPTIYDRKMLDRVKFSKERFEDFQSHHDALVESLHLLSAPPPHIFSGDGIVISAGGAYFAGAMVAIAQIRETGSKLPIEVMINTRAEYDQILCQTLKDEFNAKCVIIEDEVGQPMLEALNLSKFQLKILGLLVTSFENVIALDADNMALMNPDDLLSTPEYLKTKFILWPDLWQRAISTSYYDIARLTPGMAIRRHGISNKDDAKEYFTKNPDSVHFHDREGIPSAVSTETGQMAFSKRDHYRSLYLSLYYNVYGESHYWRMFYQGVPGEGDRDTFVPALHVFNEPYYVVERATWLAGFDEQSGRFQETTIVQYDPATTSRFVQQWKKFLAKKGEDTRLAFDQNTPRTRELLKEFSEAEGDNLPPVPEVMFLHVHRPKINAVLETDPKGYFDCFKQRNLGLPGKYTDHFGKTDWELKFNLISRWTACKGLGSASWWKTVERDQTAVCQTISDYVKFLEKDSKDPQAHEFKHIKVNF